MVKFTSVKMLRFSNTHSCGAGLLVLWYCVSRLFGNPIRSLCASLCLCLAPQAGQAQDRITGVVSIIDGDTFEIHGKRIRLAGIDAPESSQNCYTEHGTPWPCGQKIANNISSLLRRKTITCDISGEDRYGRYIGTCFYKHKDINAMIVRAGLAMAYRKYSPAYIEHEETAKARKRGIWKGPFIAPWDWRKGVRVD